MSGYDTQFSGEFKLNKNLSPELHEYLKYFSAKRRMKWENLPEEFGKDGEYYYEGMTDFVSEYMFGKKVSEYNPVMVASVKCPSQPNKWCNWIPSKDGTKIVWNKRKNFNDYVTWLRYIIRNFLASRGYILNGEVYYCGDCTLDYINYEIENIDDSKTYDSADDDCGYIVVEDNIVNYTGPIGLWKEHFIEFVDYGDDIVNKYNNVWGWSVIFIAPLGVVACGIYVYYLLYGTVNN